MSQEFALKEAEQREAAKLHELGVAGKIYRSPTTGMEFVLIFGGCFQMGDTFGDGESHEKLVHQVCLNPYYIGKYEVTQGQWKKVMGHNPSNFEGDDRPVEQVSWNDAQEFIRKLNEIEGTHKYRLPNEAEWEYAARGGGRQEKWAGTNDESSLGEYSWYGNNSHGETHPVGQKKPNSLGLYDMSGNVAEWIADWYGEDYYRLSPRNDPKGPSSGTSKVLRGGSWIFLPRDVRVASRFSLDPRVRFFSYGFRLGLSPR
jgi:formylglycine-generating enzyme required for sulfatase activity